VKIPICKPPSVEDFSPKAVSKAVLCSACQHPATLFPAALGLVGVFGLLVLSSSMPFVFLATGGMAVGACSWAFNFFFRDDAIARAYTQKLYEQLDEYKQQLRQSVRMELESLQSLYFAEAYAEQGLQQFSMIKEKFENLKDVLDSKLNSSELTFSVYFGAAEQVYLAVLDNLKNAALILKSIKAIDTDYIKSRQRELKKVTKLTAADEKEILTLNQRKELYDKKLEEVNTLLTTNEEAMTDLDTTSTALASMKTSESLSSVDIETARKELEGLAKRAQKYSLGATECVDIAVQ
jgi:hypothetical protein